MRRGAEIEPKAKVPKSRNRPFRQPLSALNNLPRTKSGFSSRPRAQSSEYEPTACHDTKPLQDLPLNENVISRDTLDKFNSFGYREVEYPHPVQSSLTHPESHDFANDKRDSTYHERLDYCEYNDSSFSQYDDGNNIRMPNRYQMTEGLQYEELADDEQNSTSFGKVSKAHAANSNISGIAFYGYSGSQIFEHDYVYCEQNSQSLQYDNPNETGTPDIAPYGTAGEKLSPCMTEHSAAEFGTDQSEDYDEGIEDADFFAVIGPQAEAGQEYLDEIDIEHAFTSQVDDEEQETFTACYPCDSVYENISRSLEPRFGESDNEFPVDPELFEVSPASTYLPNLPETTEDTHDTSHYNEIPEESTIQTNVSFAETSHPVITTEDNSFDSDSHTWDVPSVSDREPDVQTESYTIAKEHTRVKHIDFPSSSQMGMGVSFDFPEQSSSATNRGMTDCVGAFSLPHYIKPQVSPQKASEFGLSELNQEATPATSPTDSPKPCPQAFLRSKFPAPVPERSPIQGLTSSHTLLRTCFRVAEALRVHFAARPFIPESPRTATSDITRDKPPTPSSTGTKIPASTTILIELYAYVTRSYRSGHRQFFTFADLFFPFQPPYMSGVWECWATEPLYNSDGKEFLGVGGKEWRRAGSEHANSATFTKRIQSNGQSEEEEPAGRMCRVIGTFPSSDYAPPAKGAERASGPNHVMLTILSIWRATWEDVEYVRGIVQA